MLSALRAPTPKNANLLSDAGPVTPVVVYTGPTRTPAQIANLANLPEAADTGKKKAKHKPVAAKAADAAKPAEGKPAVQSPRTRKPAAAKPAEKKPAAGKTTDGQAYGRQDARRPPVHGHRCHPRRWLPARRPNSKRTRPGPAKQADDNAIIPASIPRSSRSFAAPAAVLKQRRPSGSKRACTPR